MKNELKATTFKPNRKRNISVAKRLDNAVGFGVSREAKSAVQYSQNLFLSPGRRHQSAAPWRR